MQLGTLSRGSRETPVLGVRGAHLPQHTHSVLLGWSLEPQPSSLYNGNN